MLMVVNIVENCIKWAKQSKINCCQSAALKAAHASKESTTGTIRNLIFSVVPFNAGAN